MREYPILLVIDESRNDEGRYQRLGSVTGRTASHAIAKARRKFHIGSRAIVAAELSVASSLTVLER
jgi:hypothetical protein